MSIYSRIYGKTPKDKKSPEPQIKDDGKAATRVLAGLKVQNAHMQRVELPDGKNIDIPKMEYVHLLDKQVRDLRDENRDLKIKNEKYEGKIARLEATVNKFYNEFRDLKANSIQRPKFKKSKP